ncbi:hypothetical protein FE257_003600 [Aspergillus nanangensis]|uniref:Alpha/beta hydrolase fold-3 domain-containing protein n=1 Tax=Aspergillus nanangensis TaxID=2582783 RepID=A0AAD4CRW5_ASPNN|nr:hypothetical protein FE257_003600 [Aspergillus nanangensis]
MAVMDQYTYVFAIGTIFAMLDAFNNGANDVANSWATSVSSRSISYPMAMVCGTVFELLGAITVGARTADTIKNNIIPPEAFKEDAGVQMLAFACALAAASSWVMWCTRHSTHVSSTYSLISAVAGVGVAVAGASEVQWGWNKGKGLGAIFAGLGMAPVIAAGFGGIIFMLIKLTVHMRKNPLPWAVYTSPVFFLIAGTICTLSIVYKGSPNLHLDKKPSWWVAAVTVGTGAGLALVAAIFFVPWIHARIIKRDPSVRWYMVIMGPLLFQRPAPANSEASVVPDYAVIQKEHDLDAESTDGADAENNDKQQVSIETNQLSYKEIMEQGEQRFHARLRKGRGPLGWAMRLLHDNPVGAGEIYELHNLAIIAKRIPAMIVVGALYGLNYDIHAAQSGVEGTPEGARMARVYARAKKYPNEVEHSYSFVQIITACTASFAHGANDIGNAVGPWAVLYSAWTTGKASESKAPVPVWQLAVMALTLSLGLVTYGYNIMKVMGNKITYHSPSRGCSMEMGAAITVLIFSQFSLPVSTSMCITGATIGVGLCNGDYRAVNWQRRAPGQSVRATVFRPPRHEGSRPRPLHLDIHGGGFIGGLPEGDAWFCEKVMAATGAVVVSAAYRYAPRHTFPSAHEDVQDVAAYLIEHADAWGIDPRLITVSGFSAGSNLALGVAQGLADSPYAVKGATLADAVVDLRIPPWEKPKPAGFPAWDPLAWLMPLFDAYAGPNRARDLENPLLSPIVADIRTLPRNMLFIITGNDILLEEQTAFAKRLKQDAAELNAVDMVSEVGSDISNTSYHVESPVFEGQMHGWLALPSGVVDGNTRTAAVDQAIRFLQDVHANCSLGSGLDIGSRSPQALDKRRLRVARRAKRYKRSLSGHHRTSGEGESASERKLGNNETSDEENSEDDDDEDEPSSDYSDYEGLRDYEESLSYDPDLVSDSSLNWLDAVVCLGFNPNQVGGAQAFITGKADYEDCNLIHFADINDGQSDGDYYCYYVPDAIDPVVFPIHGSCLEVFTRAITGSTDINLLDKEALYNTMAELSSYSALNLPYGDIHGPDQDWQCIPGEEYSVTNPMSIDGVKEFLKENLPRNKDHCPNKSPVDTTQRIAGDPFRYIPYDVAYLILSYLSGHSLQALIKASAVFKNVSRGEGFWKQVLVRHMPWFWELQDMVRDSAIADINYKETYLWLEKETTVPFGMRGLLLGIANRRRIWNTCEHLADRYFQAIDLDLTDADLDVTQKISDNMLTGVTGETCEDGRFCRMGILQALHLPELVPMEALVWAKEPQELSKLQRISAYIQGDSPSDDMHRTGNERTVIVAGLRVEFIRRYWEPRRYIGDDSDWTEDMMRHFDINGPAGEYITSIETGYGVDDTGNACQLKRQWPMDPGNSSPLFITQEAICAYPISTVYNDCPRYLYYALLFISCVTRWRGWLADVFLGTAAVYAGTAAFQAFILLAGRHHHTRVAEPVSIPPLADQSPLISSFPSLVTNADEVTVDPGALDLDGDAVLAVVVTGYLVFLPLQCWSCSLQHKRAKYIIVLSWNLLMLSGTVCALIYSSVSNRTPIQYMFCHPEFAPYDEINNDGWQQSLWKSSWNTTVWSLFANISNLNQLESVCFYPCFNTTQILRQPTSLKASVASGDLSQTAQQDVWNKLQYSQGYIYALIVLSVALNVVLLVYRFLPYSSRIPSLHPSRIWKQRKSIYTGLKKDLIQSLHEVKQAICDSQPFGIRHLYRGYKVFSPHCARLWVYPCADIVVLTAYAFSLFVSPLTVIAFVIWVEWFIGNDGPQEEHPQQVGQWSPLVGLGLVLISAGILRLKYRLASAEELDHEISHARSRLLDLESLKQARLDRRPQMSAVSESNETS